MWCCQERIALCLASLTTSKKGRWFFSMQRSAICSHCSLVGSMPVGLCAHPAQHPSRHSLSICVGFHMDDIRVLYIDL